MTIADLLITSLLAVWILSLLYITYTIARTTTARDLGHLYGLYHALRRLDHPRREALPMAISIHTTIRVAQGTVDLIETVVDDTINRIQDSTQHRDWPPISPIEKMNRYLPLQYPYERVRVSWPPFMGLRVELGGDSA